jgi:hypothetical protein
MGKTEARVDLFTKGKSDIDRTCHQSQQSQARWRMTMATVVLRPCWPCLPCLPCLTGPLTSHSPSKLARFSTTGVSDVGTVCGGKRTVSSLKMLGNDIAINLDAMYSNV